MGRSSTAPFFVLEINPAPMKFAVLAAAALVSISAPVYAAGSNDQGLIRTSGTVNATCSIDDLTITLASDGSNKLKGNGLVSVAQTGKTKWTIGRTEAVEGNGFTSKLNFRGYSNLQLESTQSQGETVVVDGRQGGRASVDVTLTAPNGFGPGRYQTQTTVQCVVQ